MAASLSRPDPSSPASVAEAGFSTTRRGFSQDEVRAFLTSVAAELGRLQERERQLEAQVRAAEADVAPAPEIDEETVAAILGEETLRVLQTARESASQIKIRAEETAAKVIGDASDEVNRLRQEAEVEAARKRHDASSDAEAEVALAKQQGREMVNEARAYRERVLADLERRTKLARHQIEELVHGRDRLLQVFERARLVAVDVTTELQSVDGPDELVNFSPTTGPLPLMVPAGSLDESAVAPATDEPADTAVDVVDVVDDVDDVEPARSDDDGVELEPGSSSPEAAAETIADVILDDATADDSASDADAMADADGVEASEQVTDDVENHELVDDVVAHAPEVADAAEDAEPAGPKRDANVVSLFRERPTDAGIVGETTEVTDVEPASDDAGDGGAIDVNGIFERLRGDAPPSDDTDGTDDRNGNSDDSVGRHNDSSDSNDAGDGDPDAEPGTDADADIGPTPFSRRDEALVPLIVSGARKLKRVLADEQNGVLDQLRRNEPVTDLDELVAAADQHVQTYVAALADELLDAAVAGAVEVGKNDTKTLRTSLRRGGALERANAIVGEDLVVPMRQRLERAVADGGGDNDDITKRVRAVYREWKTQHIDDQLDDAFRFAHGGGIFAGVRPGTPLRWSIDPAEPTCPDCEDNSLADAVAAGDEFPTGHVSAPAHPGCRCLTVPADQ